MIGGSTFTFGDKILVGVHIGILTKSRRDMVLKDDKFLKTKFPFLVSQYKKLETVFVKHYAPKYVPDTKGE